MPVQIFINAVEVTDIVLNGSATRRLNRPAQATVRIPSHLLPDLGILEVGFPLKVVFDGNLFFHGTILMLEDECDEDTCYTTFSATDPSELWEWRPARAGPDSGDPGDFSNPDLFLDPSTEGPEIFRQILLQSEDDSDPQFGEGPLGLELGGFETGGVDLSGAPTDYPMTIAEIATLLTETGEVDIIITPIDSGGNLGRVDVFNGDYGNDLTGAVFFDYARDNHNVRGLRQVLDMSSMCNKLWYYGGPRVLTSDDPGGVQHWCFNITGTDPEFVIGSMVIPGVTVLDERQTSQGLYGVRMDIKIWDARGENCSEEITIAERQIYRRLWLLEQFLRSRPRNMVHVTPVRTSQFDQLPPGVNPVQVGAFDIGDLVSVRGGSAVRGGFEGGQRVYEYTVNWDSEGVYELGELVTSPSQEGI